jgi:hypothetical protein
MRKLFVLGVALAMASTAFAAPNIVNVSQKGSVLVFPDIRVDTFRPGVTHNTLVRINNDGPSYIHVKCFWMDGNKNRLDLSFNMTPFQPVWFDAKNGDGSSPVTPFPSLPSNGWGPPTGRGLLVCWPTDIEEMNQLKYNHLYGSAQVIGDDGTAYEYSAYAFYAQVPGLDGTTVVGTGGDINMNGFYYDQCAEYQAGSFTPQGVTIASVPATFGATRIAFAGCVIDLTQDWTATYTKLVFELWNKYENKFTGAYDCANSWHEIYLVAQAGQTMLDAYAAAGASVFDMGALNSDGNRFRVTGTASTSSRCGVTGNPSVKAGVMGVQSTWITAPATGLAGNTLTNAGKIAGRIRWDAKLNPTPDGGIR